MRGKLFWLIVALIIIAIIFSVVGNNGENVENFKPLELEVGDVFTYIDYSNTMYVLNYAMADVTGDDIKDMIIMVGEKESVDATNATNIDVVVYDSSEEKFYNLNLKKYNGESPRIETYDMTGNGILDIILIVNTYRETEVRIVSMQNMEFKEIFKAKDNKGITFTGNFLDGFKVYVKSAKYGKEVNLNVEDRKVNYVSKGYYDESGRLLKENAKVTTSGFSAVEIIQLDRYFGLQTTQRILGFDEEDLLEEIVSIWKYEDGKWKLKESKGNKIGNLLY